MSTPQDIFSDATDHHFLEYDARRDADVLTLRAALAATLRALKSLSATAVVGLGPSHASRLSGQRVTDVVPFEPIDGVLRAPATGGDVWLWIRAGHRSQVMDAALAAQRTMAGQGRPYRLREETVGYRYREGRDLSGFRDGAANPDEATRDAVAWRDDGSSVVLTQRWAHRMDKLAKLTQAEKDRLVGRSMETDERLQAGDFDPPEHDFRAAHVQRVHQDTHGEIYRRSVTYGGVVEAGLYFLGFCAEQARFDRMLRSMLGCAQDAFADRWTYYSTPVSGAYWYLPSLQALGAWTTEGD